MIDLTCERIDAAGMPEQYAAGTLPRPELQYFEAHLLVCARCQSSVETAAAVRRVPLVAPPSAKRPGSYRWLGIALAAASIAVVTFWPRAGARFRDLSTLATPPIYEGIPVRGPAVSGESLFASGMRAYAAHEYPRARHQLAAALAAGADVQPTAFFLGASDLMDHDARAARDHFSAVIAAGESPYLHEAHYYRALALLREGDAHSALGDLDAIAPGTDSIAGVARSLAARVRERIQP